ncbi:hypothetical protein SLS53_007565 [Cytospora paraplurivora]|uniref:ER transporter 6TM N-terminal domain-containing protein n=1 Tax=Cytospora paraplurivora TaxID=2898453 RepID=A0AAN9U2W7_9PEZI
MAVEAAATPPPRPTVHDSQEDEKAIEELTEQRDEDSSSSYVPDNGSHILRNHPTHEDDVAVAAAQEKHDAEAAVDAAAKPKPPTITAKVMQKLGVNPVILKGSITPVISLAIYQAPPVMHRLTTLGYLVGIMGTCSLCILPRGKFLQTLFLEIIAASIGSAMAMFITYLGVRARLNTSDHAELAAYIAEHGKAPYNSSQSAVCAILLMFNIWCTNIVKAKYPAFNIPVVVYSVMVIVASTFGPEFPSVTAAKTFTKRLIVGSWWGLAIGTGVSLFIFPVSNRQIVLKQMGGLLGLFKKSIALEKKYLQGLEKEDMFALEAVETSAGQSEPERKGGKKEKAPPLTKEQRTAMELRGAIAATRELMGKIYGDIKFAKRDFAWGYLSANDYSEMFNLMRTFIIPMTGISTIMDIFQRVGRDRGWDGSEEADDGLFAQHIKPLGKDESQRIWNDIMKQLHEPFEILSEAIVQGVDHAGILLGLLPQPKELKKADATADVEASAGQLRPGQVGYSQIINKKVDAFKTRKSEILRIWAKEKGLSSDGRPENWTEEATHFFEKRRNDQAQLYVILYLEKLMQATGEAVQDFVAFAELKANDGTFSKKRFIFPSERRLKKWLLTIFSNEDTAVEESSDILDAGTSVVYIGHGWKNKMDPEHLAPTNNWQKFGEYLRKISAFFGSPESVFGFRVVCALMTLGVVAYLERTQAFFIKQRLMWGMIIIAISMGQTSGQSIFNFLLRIGATTVAMVVNFLVWYIVDQKTPGILVLFWIACFCEYYVCFRWPRLIPGVIVCIVTEILVIGYELQVRKLGIAGATASGQVYYPIYELAPYRLAIISGGAFIAFFWTVFPYPFSDRAWLRKDLSAVLYLLANYSSVINTTMKASISGTLGDVDVPGSPAQNLFKIRRKMFGKLSLLLPSLQMHANFQKWEPSIGGKFPEEKYQDIILRSTRITNYLTLMSYVLSWESKDEDVHDKEWMGLLGEVFHGVSPVQHQILSTLTLLSNCLVSGQSLPPFMPLMKPHEVTRRLLHLPVDPKSNNPRTGYRTPAARSSASSFSSSSSDSSLSDDDDVDEEADQGKSPAASQDHVPQSDGQGRRVPAVWDLLDARNMDQKGYTEFAVLHVCTTLIMGDLEGLIKTIGSLVGTVDFSFEVAQDMASTSDLGSIHRMGTWASRASNAAGSSSDDNRRKGKKD